MSLRQMEQFVAVAEELHFGRAARRLNMAQPPLSQSIRRLEVGLGVDLLDRSKRSVELTRAGRVFVDEARQTLRQAEIARRLAQRAAAELREVRVSFIGPALFQLLPDLIVGFRATAPDIHVRLIECASPEQVEGIRAGEFDVGFITDGVAHPGCESVLVERARFIAAVPADSPLGGLASVGLLELAEQPFLLPPQKHGAQIDALGLFKSAGLMPHVAQEANQTNTTLSLVGARLGCSVVMATAALTHPRNVHFLPIDDDRWHSCWEMGMVWHPDRLGALAARFVGFARDYVRRNPHLLELDTPGTPWPVRRSAAGGSGRGSRAAGPGSARTRPAAPRR